ncbi:MAG: agmatine deiminase family protein [Gammaproteobacteria bacterium]
MPAEWGPHQCTWVSWPHNKKTWPGKFASVEPVMARLVGALSQNELVRLNVLDAAHERHVRNQIEDHVNARNIAFHHFPTNDAWCRDHGAIFVTRSDQDDPMLALDFQYNAWGGKYPPYDLDNAIAAKMAAALDVPGYAVDMVLEGGSIDVNGAGALLTTQQCLLHPNRNPSLSRDAIEALLRDTLGVRQILWLGEGITGDDTDGHIDDLTRFVAEDTVITMVEHNRSDENYLPLAENRQRLAGMQLADGRPLKVLEMQMPQPVEYEGDRLPASYANFYIGNRVVLMPTFDDPADEPGLQVLARCFPGREVIGIDCTDLVLGLGTFHCLTQQVPMV